MKQKWIFVLLWITLFAAFAEADTEPFYFKNHYPSFMQLKGRVKIVLVEKSQYIEKFEQAEEEKYRKFVHFFVYAPQGFLLYDSDAYNYKYSFIAFDGRGDIDRFSLAAKSEIEHPSEVNGVYEDTRDISFYYNARGYLTGWESDTRVELEYSEDFVKKLTAYSGSVSTQGVKTVNYCEAYTYDDKGRLAQKEYFIGRDALEKIWIYKYDNKGNLLDCSLYSENGDLRSKSVYNYKNNVLAEIHFYAGKGRESFLVNEYLFDRQGNLLKEGKSYGPFIYLNSYDKNGLLAETTVCDKDSTHAKTKFVYTKNDAFGNWVECVAYKPVIKLGKETFTPDCKYYRTITYYKQ